MGTSWGSLVGRGSGGERFVSVDAELFLGKWYRYKHDSAHADKVNLSTIAGRHREKMKCSKKQSSKDGQQEMIFVCILLFRYSYLALEISVIDFHPVQ